LKSISELEETKAVQCKSIENFLALRQNMIRCNAENKQDSKAVSPSEETTTTTTTRSVDHSAILGHLVQDMDQFEYTITSPGGISDTKPSSEENQVSRDFNELSFNLYNITALTNTSTFSYLSVSAPPKKVFASRDEQI
jgi:hypothetical protein